MAFRPQDSGPALRACPTRSRAPGIGLCPVFHFVAPEGDFQGGEVFVRVGCNLSVVTYGTVAPGLAAGQARLFALDAAARMKQSR